MSEKTKIDVDECFDLCRELAGKNPEAAIVAIAISYRDGSRVTFEQNEILKERMQRDEI